jgi:hypothetical protein
MQKSHRFCSAVCKENYKNDKSRRNADTHHEEGVKNKNKCRWCKVRLGGTAKLKSVFVSVYAMERYCGGPEEGGWWDNWYTLLYSVPRRGGNIERTKQKFQAEIDSDDDQFEKDNGRKRRNQYSVVPDGDDMVVVTEDYPGQRNTTSKAHYE